MTKNIVPRRHDNLNNLSNRTIQTESSEINIPKFALIKTEFLLTKAELATIYAGRPDREINLVGCKQPQLRLLWCP